MLLTKKTPPGRVVKQFGWIFRGGRLFCGAKVTNLKVAAFFFQKRICLYSMFLTQPVWSFSGIALPLMKGKETGIVSHVPYQATNIRLTQLDLALMHFTLSLPTWLIVKPHLEEVEEWGSALIPYFILGCPRKSPNRGGWGHTFSEKKPMEFKNFSVYP